MTDAQFYNGFIFKRFEFNKYHTTDCITNGGSARHYFGKLTCGRARLLTEKYSVELKAGDVFYIPYGIRYRSNWYPDEKGVSFYSLGFSHLPSEVDYKIQKVDCGQNDNLDTVCRDLTVNAKTVAALYNFFADVQDIMIPRCNRPQDTVSAYAVDIMRKNPDIAISELAKACRVSESGLYNVFRRTLDCTPLDIRRKIKVERAVDMLVTTDLSVETISSNLGFSSSSYFRKILAKERGQTPSEIRAKSI